MRCHKAGKPRPLHGRLQLSGINVCKHRNVLPQRGIKKERILPHQRHRLPERLKARVAQLAPIEGNPTVVVGVRTHEQREQRRLPAARCPHHGVAATCGKLHAQARENGAVLVIAKGNV